MRVSKEAYTPTGKHEFAVSSGELFLGNPFSANYVPGADQIHELIMSISKLELPNRLAYLPHGYWIETDPEAVFSICKKRAALILVDPRIPDGSDPLQGLGQKIKTPKGKIGEIITNTGHDWGQLLIGDPKYLQIKTNSGVILKVPNGRYHCTVNCEALVCIADVEQIRNIVLRRLDTREATPTDDYVINYPFWYTTPEKAEQDRMDFERLKAMGVFVFEDELKTQSSEPVPE